MISFQPYFVVPHGSLRFAECVRGVQPLDFTQSWGLALALTVRTP